MKRRLCSLLTAVLLTFSVLLAASPAVVFAGSNSDVIFSYLTSELGLNSAAACGIMGNIYQECTMNPDAAGSSYYGICQWGGSRLSNLRAYCEEHGFSSSSLEGQLGYLRYELENCYTGTLDYLCNVENSYEGAYNAAVYFCTNFEQPGNLSWENATRGSYAADMFWPEYGA